MQVRDNYYLDFIAPFAEMVGFFFSGITACSRSNDTRVAMLDAFALGTHTLLRDALAQGTRTLMRDGLRRARPWPAVHLHRPLSYQTVTVRQDHTRP